MLIDFCPKCAIMYNVRQKIPYDQQQENEARRDVNISSSKNERRQDKLQRLKIDLEINGDDLEEDEIEELIDEGWI